jgi:hypothetical protein
LLSDAFGTIPLSASGPWPLRAPISNSAAVPRPHSATIPTHPSVSLSTDRGRVAHGSWPGTHTHSLIYPALPPLSLPGPLLTSLRPSPLHAFSSLSYHLDTQQLPSSHPKNPPGSAPWVYSPQSYSPPQRCTEMSGFAKFWPASSPSSPSAMPSTSLVSLICRVEV